MPKVDETAIRAALEAPLGLLPGEDSGTFSGLPVTRVAETHDPRGPHIRVALIREPRAELYRGIRRAKGVLDVLCHVPVADGLAAAEAIAKQIPPLYRASDTANATITASGITITIREISIMSSYRGVDEAKDGAQQWLVVPVQIDWRVDLTA